VDRLTRLVVVISALCALALQVDLGARGWPPLRLLTPAVFVLTWIAARVAPRLARAIVLASASVFPVLVFVTTNGFEAGHLALWTAALLGLVTGRAGLFGRWSLPPIWRLSLGAWALAVAFVWPVVVWREIDFSPALLDSYHVGVTAIGVAPPIEVLWIAHVAALHLSGILWIDALFHDWGRGDRPGFERQIAWPLALGAVVGALIGVYQMFGHLFVLSAGTFAVDGRATGGMLDANAFGMIAAVWAVAVVELVRGRVWAIRAPGFALAAVLAAGVWASGSRTAIVALVIGAAALAVAMARERPKWALAGVATVAAGILLVVGLLHFAGARASTVGPIPRFKAMLSTSGPDGMQSVLAELWNRNGYGAMATRMVRDWPATGVGVGVFNTIVIDYSKRFFHRLPPDNAQNWLRHQLAEFGVLGSLGWVIWIVVFIRLLVRRGDPRTRVSRGALTGVLLGLGVASLGGMPTQNDFVLVMFWTVVFWFAIAAGVVVASPAEPVSGRRWLWPVAVAIVFAAASAWAAVTGLRLPERAMRGDWDFEYGLAPAEHLPDGSVFRWTEGHAVWVASYDRPIVRLTYWVHHPDVATRPVHVQIWTQSRSLVDEWLQDNASHSVYVRINGWAAPGSPDWRPGAERLMLETRVDRTWRPSDTGGTDTRELGIGLSPVVVLSPPSGLNTLDSGR
jgi:O-antigen ligase